MDLVRVIAHLKAHVPLLEGRVAGAAEFSAMMAGELRPEIYPAAYVIPLGESAEDNDAMNAVYQVVTERLGVVVAFDNTADRRGQGVTQLYRPMRAALFAALLNWRGTDPDRALRGFELGSGGLLQQDRARVFYQWEFTLLTAWTECDGWQQPSTPLLAIEANQQPGDPQPPLRVLLPQP